MVDMRAEEDLSEEALIWCCFRLSYTAIFDRCCDRVNAPVEAIDDVAARMAAAVVNFMVRVLCVKLVFVFFEMALCQLLIFFAS